ncbi:hypothetical protein FRB97_002563, partial [Tulasnella sp. 331]
EHESRDYFAPELREAYKIYEELCDRYMMTRRTLTLAGTNRSAYKCMEAHDLFLKRGAKWGMAICLKVVGGVCGFKDELDAFTTLANAITIYKDLDAPHGALNKYAKACALYQELGCHEGMASCLAGMAAPQITHKLYASAISFFGEAFAILKGKKKPWDMERCLDKLAGSTRSGARLIA